MTTYCCRGTPGIGKSWFGELLMWVMVNIGVRVVYQQSLESLWYFFDFGRDYVRCTPISTRLAWPKDFSSDHFACVIFDPAASGAAVVPLKVPQFTVVTASPNRQHFKEFLKYAEELRYMPFWSLSDLYRILPYCNLPGTLAEKRAMLEKRFQVVGGVPRKLFGSTSLDVWQMAIDADLRQEAGGIASMLLDYPGVMRDCAKNHSDLVFLHSSPPFDRTRLYLASDYVRRTYAQMGQYRRAQAAEIEEAWDDPTFAAEAGHKFRPFAFEAIFLGGRFSLHGFREDGTHEPSATDYQLGPFYGLETIASPASIETILPGVFYRPSQPKFPLPDYFALCGDDLFLFQMTVSSQKPNPAGIFSHSQLRPLLELYSKSNLNGRVVVVFVAPDFIYRSFSLTQSGWKKWSSVHSSAGPFRFSDPLKILSCPCVAAVLYLPISPSSP